MNLETIQEALADQLASHLQQLALGAAEDVEAYAAEIAADAVEAAALGRDDLLEHLQAQLGALAEKHRLEAAKVANSIVPALISGVAAVLSTALVEGAGGEA